MMSENNEPRKRFLALDTATATLCVAVTENGKLIHEINASGERNHSVHLLPIIEQALQASGTAGNTLGGIAVGIGPGSYTGTRIAVSAAKTLAWAWDIPVFGVSSMHAMAYGGYVKGRADNVPLNVQYDNGDTGSGSDWIIPLLDARRGQAFTALFEAGEHSPVRLVPDGIRLMKDWVQHLAELLQQAEAAGNKPRMLWFVGETGLHGSEESLLPLKEICNVRVVPYDLEGRWTGFLGEERRSGEKDDIHSLIPNYTQLTEAEVNLRKSSEGGTR